MITGAEFYNVMCAMVPLYVVMLLAYGSVRWWQVFSPAQCSGVNRFVALFAIPLLSFYFIAANNPYTMNFRFLAADSLQKLLLLAVLASWCLLFRRSSLDWAISFFSLATLPNTLVIGIPLLGGMYGPHSSTLMVQIVVLQGIVWYTLILFLLEFRAARVLIADRFPGANAAAIASIAVDPDVVSLHGGREVLETEADVAGDGRIRVTVRRSSASRRSVSLRFVGATPRASDLSDAEIYSLSRGSSINSSDFYSMVARSSSFGVPSPRPSNYVEDFSNADSKCKAPEKTETEAEIGDKRANREAPLLRAAAEAAINSSGAKEALVAITTAKTEGQRENELRLGIGDEAIVEGLDNGGLTPAEETTMPASTVMMRLILTMMWRKLIRNPNTYSGLIGLLWALIAYRWQLDFPVIISNSIKILSNAGLGMAMFSLGLFMALQPRIIACGNKLAAFAMAVRFLVGPAVAAAAAAAAIVGLRGDILRIAIVQAALPQGIVPFVFATEYNLHADIVSTAVIFGMLIALPVALVYYILLGL